MVADNRFSSEQRCRVVLRLFSLGITSSATAEEQAQIASQRLFANAGASSSTSFAGIGCVIRADANQQRLLVFPAN